jgi:putative FmdB family regulatory protein
MPIYEWECLVCDLTFEDLAPVSEGRLERACPSCGRMSPRVVSAFAIASGAFAQPQSAPTPAGGSGAKSPICLRYPHIPLLCHMDQPTAERAVAYAHGRGAEYDDKKGTREELRKKRGLPPPPPPAPPAHAHSHNPRRHQGGATPADHSAAGHSHDHADSRGHPHGTPAKGAPGKGAKPGPASGAASHSG